MVKKKERQRTRNNRLRRIEKTGLELLIDATKFGGTNIPHSAELLECMMGYFGGVNGFAAMLVKQFYDAAPGSNVRNKLLEMIVRLTSKNTDQGGAKKPLTLWTEEELETELDNRFKIAVQQYQGRVIDGTQLPDPAQASQSEPARIAASPSDLTASEGGIEELTKRASEQAARELEALPSDSPARRLPQVPSE